MGINLNHEILAAELINVAINARVEEASLT